MIQNRVRPALTWLLPTARCFSFFFLKDLMSKERLTHIEWQVGSGTVNDSSLLLLLRHEHKPI